MMRSWVCLALIFAAPAGFAQSILAEDQPLQLPSVGHSQLRILTPTLLELSHVTTKADPEAPPREWNFFAKSGRANLPGANAFAVTAGERTLKIEAVGFRRRVLYAPLKERDLRIGNSLYLRLADSIRTNEIVEVRNPDSRLWRNENFKAIADPFRWSPAIHVNQTGYLPAHSKLAMVGFYLGSLGELTLERGRLARTDREQRAVEPAVPLPFHIIDAITHSIRFTGELKPRPDRGFPFASYNHVLEADFTEFRERGEFRLHVPGLGVSWPFRIGDEVAANWARTYALGIYHQRCGTANELPFTRFAHGPCHTAPAEVPTMSSRFENVNYVLEQETEGAQKERHSARPLKNVAASLYPFVTKGPVDVRGGHHDAGDYSKYTENSANFIHLLVFAADNFAGVRDLDNLGLPESGDGKSDILQEARWEADFLARMQDADGGFYFLVYPRERRYENDVTPDRGDPQVVFPKTTAVTAAAVAALAQCASSPTFKEQFPESAALYLEKAKKGWAFLERAIAQHGKDGAYQKITHYGNDFIHDDELAWAACEMFLATGDENIHEQLLDWLNPADPGTRKWSWWRLFEAYGHAIRSYAFAESSRRIQRTKLDPKLLEACENEIITAAEDHLKRADSSAYGTSFPIETKRTRTAGWYFSSDAAFDLTTALQLPYPVNNDPRPQFLKALLSNVNYEFGCNPLNVTFLTGAGWHWPREIVHQYAQNDRRTLPLTGIPLGNIQDGFGWLDHYGKELGALSYPADDDPTAPYPMYDRWGDSFNLKTEFVISNQARGLAALAWLMAQTPLKNQPWKPGGAKIAGLPARIQTGKPLRLTLQADNLDLKDARIIWETGGEPFIGAQFEYRPKPGESWIEAEATLPDGRRVFATRDPYR